MGESKGFKKVLLIGIAGTLKDFLLSLPSLKCFVCQDEFIRENTKIILKQYPINEKPEKILEDIQQENPDLLGFSCYTWNIDCIFEIIKNLENSNSKGTKIFLGGPEITKEDIINGRFNNLNVDFLIFGEGEKPFLNLLKNKKDAVKGLAYKEDDRFICSEGPDLLENLEKIPSPYLNGYVSDEIFSREGIRANIETQRGCNFRCAYCFYHKNFPCIRYRNPETVIQEIEYVYNKGVCAIRVTDANFLSDGGFAKKIIRGLVDKKIEMSIFLELHPMFMDEEISELFKRYIELSPKNRIIAGVGIQTINQEALAVIKRKIPLRFFENAFDLLQKAGVIIKSDVIFGLPRETLKTYYETLEYMAEKMRYKKNFLTLAPLRILPGTDLVEIAEKENFQIDKRDSSHYVYSSPTMPREEIVEGLRMNSVACRLLSTEDKENRMKIRDLYFEVKDSLKASHIELFMYFMKEFFEYLKNNKADADFVKEDFPNPEDYCFKKVFDDILDEWLIEKLNFLKQNGIPKEMKNKRKFNILIAASGTVTAQCAMKGFQEQDEFDYKLVTADMNEDNAGRYFGHKFYKVPAAKDEIYIQKLLDICRKEEIDLLIPILDIELPAIAENKERFLEAGCFPLVSSIETIKICNDKYQTYDFFKNLGIEAVETYKAEDIISGKVKIDYPIFGKPAKGFASINSRIIEDEEELEKWAEKTENPIIQKLMKGKEYSIDVLSDLNGNVIEIVPRTRDETKHGASVKGVTVKDYEMIDKARKIAENLKIIGPSNIQCFKENNGEIYFFEINPRFSGAHAHSIASGMNSPHLLLKMLDGQEVKPRIGQFSEGVKMLRYWQEVIIDKEGNIRKSPLKKKVGIVFDFDGVLVDYSYRYHKTFEDVLRKFNFPCLDRKTIYNLRREHCLGQKEMLDRYLVPENMKNRAEIIDKIVEERNSIIENEEYLQEDRFFDGTIDLLRKLRDEGYIIGLITKRKDEKLFLKQLGENSALFDFIKITQNKEDALKEFISQHGINECYFLTDYSPEITEANRLKMMGTDGIKTVGVASGIESRENLAKSAPDFIIENVNELKDIIKHNNI